MTLTNNSEFQFSSDKRRFRLRFEDDSLLACEAVFWRIMKQKPKVIYVKAKQGMRDEMPDCTDTEMEGKKIRRYYQLLFQIKCLIRDDKTHTGKEQCQAISEPLATWK